MIEKIYLAHNLKINSNQEESFFHKNKYNPKIKKNNFQSKKVV